ncbi:zinc finger protein 335 [Drosophila takahashii]|uniref:zinc finger protein 335 n=1 Tax=Drosophila takahashii TaxID=29030 RepID=UPI001CF8C478|nr:zinc finger protein 335 [Drosophila takahashii]
MELPSMVERSGNCLVVRSLFNGAAMYRTALEGEEGLGLPMARGLQPLMGADTLERQLERCRVSSLMLPLPLPGPLSIGAAAPVASVKDNIEVALPEANPSNNEELPQCKIRRNYSCNQCSFFTQNPRNHLSHLRDVHGERIVINECKLCLYASRHFQKLVRHMKMVHGCSDDGGGVPGSGGQMRGKRNLSREVRKRRLEESIEMQAATGPLLSPSLMQMLQNGPPLEQLKIELQQQEQQLLASVQAYNRQQEMLQLQQIVDSHDNIFSMAFEFQTKLMPPKLKDSLRLDPNNSSSDSEEASKSPSPDSFELPPGVEQFQCQKCSYSTPIRSRFKKHVKYHSMPLIKCSSCDFHTPYKWNLDRHTKNHGANGHFKCSACDFSTDIKQSLTIHELNHHVPTVGTRRREEADEQLDQQPSGSRKPEMDKVGPPITAPDSPLPELPGIVCSHCQKRVANAIELINHLQVCAPALRNTTHLQAVLNGEMDFQDEDLPNAPTDLSYCGVETAPGYGEVTEVLPEETDGSAPLKKVFKCPHCTFWAATASRFHVHIVGHLNRKPFECSLCAYRSNWRWDITKHIRLKAIRDRSHNQAQVLMNDETGRRNYAKYNQYLTLMKVNADEMTDSKGTRTGEMIVMPPEKLAEHHPMETEEIMVYSSSSTSALDLSKRKEANPEESGKEKTQQQTEETEFLMNLEPLKFKALNPSNAKSNSKESPLNLTKSDGGQSDELTSSDDSQESTDSD